MDKINGFSTISRKFSQQGMHAGSKRSHPPCILSLLTIPSQKPRGPASPDRVDGIPGTQPISVQAGPAEPLSPQQPPVTASPASHLYKDGTSRLPWPPARLPPSRKPLNCYTGPHVPSRAGLLVLGRSADKAVRGPSYISRGSPSGCRGARAPAPPWPPRTSPRWDAGPRGPGAGGGARGGSPRGRGAHLVEMRISRQQVAALVGVAAAGGSGLHGRHGGGAGAECGGRRPREGRPRGRGRAWVARGGGEAGGARALPPPPRPGGPREALSHRGTGRAAVRAGGGGGGAPGGRAGGERATWARTGEGRAARSPGFLRVVHCPPLTPPSWMPALPRCRRG